MAGRRAAARLPLSQAVLKRLHCCLRILPSQTVYSLPQYGRYRPITLYLSPLSYYEPLLLLCLSYGCKPFIGFACRVRDQTSEQSEPKYLVRISPFSTVLCTSSLMIFSQTQTPNARHLLTCMLTLPKTFRTSKRYGSLPCSLR